MPINKPDHECVLFQNAFLFSSDAIVLTDLSGKITDINNAFCEMFGWTRDELIGKTTRIIRSKNTDDELYKKMWESIEKQGEWKGEITNRHKSGREIPVLLSITPIIQDDVKIGFMGIEIDMTERIKLNQRMAQSERLATIGKMAAKVALASWRILGCRDAGRVDLRSDQEGVPNFIEVNPLAGLNPIHSDLPILCGLTGMSFKELIAGIMEEACRRQIQTAALSGSVR